MTGTSDHHYHINILNNDEYLYESADFFAGPLVGSEDLGPALFADATGDSALKLEIECDASNPFGNCNNMQLEFGFVNCGCPPSERYITNQCSGTNDATCSSEPPESTTICFSGETSVFVQRDDTSVRSIKIQELEVGDRVLTNNNQEPFQPVYMYAHFQPEKEVEYLQIYTISLSGVNDSIYGNYTETADPRNSLNLLEISQEHMVYLYGRKGPVSADTVQIGDRLESYHGEIVIVTRIDRTIRKGLYAPLTPDGTLIVTDHQIVASTYVNVLSRLPGTSAERAERGNQGLLHPSELMHIWLSPLRVVCLLGQVWVTDPLCSHHSNEEGMHFLIAYGLDYAKLAFHSNGNIVLRWALLLCSLTATAPFRVLELSLGPTYWEHPRMSLLLVVSIVYGTFALTRYGKRNISKD